MYDKYLMREVRSRIRGKYFSEGKGRKRKSIYDMYKSNFFSTNYKDNCISFLSQEQRSLKAGDLSHQESNNMAASTMKLQSDSFTSEKVSKLLMIFPRFPPLKNR